MNLTRKRWHLLVVGCVINLFAGSLYAWSVFGAALADRLTAIGPDKVTSADLALAFGLANAVGPITMISGGAVNDRFGPKFVIAAGGLLMGAGLYFCGTAATPLEIILAYGLGFGLGLGFVYGCTVNNTMKFFPDRRGLSGGLTTAVYGSSSVILPPAAAWLIAEFGIEAAMKGLGFVFAVAIVAGGLLSMRCPPGFVPEGWTPPAKSVQRADRNWRAMIASEEFPSMIALLMCGAVAAMMILAHAYSIARNQMGFTAADASVAVSVMALANTFGRIFAGTLSDKLGRLAALTLGIAFSLAGLASLAFAGPERPPLFYAGLVSVGMAFGSFMGVFPGFTAEVFGSRNNSVNFGIMFAGFAVAGVLGPTLMGTLRGAGLVYAVCYGAAAAIAATGLFFIWRLSRIFARGGA